MILEPLQLVGEGNFNLNVIKNVEVTQSFLGLDENFRGCQDKETFVDCTTRQYIDTLIKTCNCLPFNLRITDNEVSSFFDFFFF